MPIEKQETITEAYKEIDNGIDHSVMELRQAPRQTIERFGKAHSEESFTWKRQVLHNFIERYMEQDNPAPSVITAIGELNKMEGHYAPEKSVTFNVSQDVDLQQAQSLTRQLLKHKKDY